MLSLSLKKPWTLTPRCYKDSTVVTVRIEFGAKAMREKAKAAQGKRDPKTRACYIQFGKVKDTELEKFIIS